jgi:hypothetical protein
MISYPIAMAKSLPKATPLIPNHSFHWRGRAVSLFMDQFVKDEWQMAEAHASSFIENEPSADMSVYLPGVHLTVPVTDLLWSHDGETECIDDACGGQAPLNNIKLPHETTRMKRSGTGPKLLIVSDSFGHAAAQSLFAFFDDIIVLNMINVPLLSDSEKVDLWTRVISNWRPDRAIMLMQDGNFTGIPKFVATLQTMMPPPAVSSATH